MAKSDTNKISNVKLELLRTGPAHNQLLSPLTPYIALCGEDGPVTVNIPFEHRQLLMRLDRLRYKANTDPATDEQRQSEIRDIGEAIGNVLSQVPALLTELGNAASEVGSFVHLNLVISALELGMIPFEATVAPNGFPGSGSPLFLQMRTPITITREIRRGSQISVNWDRKPRILFAYAAPQGLYVPAQTHLQALREAIEPWIKIKDNTNERIAEVKKMLTVLPNASIEKIRKECSANEYTHVHILAHGDSLLNAGVQRYGVALSTEIDPGQKDVVDGERLAIALTSRDSSGTTRYRPTLVTLATCDSGNIESVLTPGGSIAHELNAAGIPWVIASQFPLWMKASAIAAEVLYTGLLNGEDPRWVLYDLRQRLRTDSPGTHDWASIVAYSTVPPDFEKQVGLFRDKQTRLKLDVKFDRIDDLVGANEETVPIEGKQLTANQTAEIEMLCKSIRADLKKWRDELKTSNSSKDKAERLGVSAASEKRIGIAYDLVGKDYKSKAKEAYEYSRDFYREALETEPSNHWVVTQYLSIMSIPSVVDSKEKRDHLAKEFGWSWITARKMAEWHCSQSAGEARAYALGTLSELALLAPVYATPKIKTVELKAEIVRNCKEMRELLEANAFPVVSTKRQFKRYLRFWKSEEWNELAEAAVNALEG
ncbi:MAG: CHAT domain-containing protein [Methylococcaceae bacterium]|nr:CHAT domain-containing protein [Methylococcaceae bacterium]